MKPLCTTRIQDDEPYLNSIHPIHSVVELELADEGGHRIGLPMVAAFQEHEGELENRIWPAIQFDLGVFGLEGHQVPLFYYEDTGIKWVFARLNDSNRVVEIQAANRDLSRVSSFQEMVTTEFDTETREIFDRLSEKKAKTTTWEASALDFLQVPSLSSSDELTDIYDEITFKDKIYFGSIPYPIQSNFDVPLFQGVPMKFVGQVDFLTFELSSFCFYLFYDPEHRIMAQRLMFT